MMSTKAHEALEGAIPSLKKVAAGERAPGTDQLEAARVLLAIRDGLPALAAAGDGKV